MEEIFEKVERIVVFRFPFFGHTIEVSNTIVITWIVMAVLIVVAFIFTRNLSPDKPGKRQVLAEWLVQTVRNICENAIGHHGRAFVPYLGSVLLYLVLSNIITLFNFIPGVHMYPPTKDINVTATLAVMSIIVVLYASLRYKGVKGWLASFADPMPIVAPFKLLEYVTKPLSLSLRLFGNVLAAFIIMELIYQLIPFAAAPLSAYFDIFDGVLQAYIFVYLTSLYIGEAVE